MNSIGGWVGAIAMAAALAFHPQQSRAEGFTGKDFASWTKASQDSFIQTSITMAGVVASRTKRSVAGCIDDWYQPDAGNMDRRNDEVRSVIAENPDYHPSGVILAILIKACGEFK